MSLVSDIIGGVTGSTQANAATSAAQTAANAQLQALGMVQKTEAPYTQAGQQALSQYQAATAPGANVDVSQMPGYQFEQQQGQQTIQNSAAARGQALSGNTLQGLQSFGQGLAGTQFQSYLQNLMGLIQVGQGAASNTAAAGGNLISGAGASLASGIQGAGAANAQGGVNLANLGIQAFNSPIAQNALGSLFNSGGAISGAGQAAAIGSGYDPTAMAQVLGA